MSQNHDELIRRCFEIAKAASGQGNHPFGALLVKDGEVILTAENTVASDQDLTAHAELNLVRKASIEMGREILSQCTLYTSTEPCPMCSGAIYWAGIPTVVFGCSVQGLKKLAEHSLAIPSSEIFSRGAHDVRTIGPVLEEEAIRILIDYWPQETTPD